MPSPEKVKPHHQAHQRDAMTLPPSETQAIELGLGIRDRDWSDRIKACDIDAWPQVFPRLA